MAAAARLAFVYLGRRGAMARFTFDLARAAASMSDVEASFVIARDNELAEAFDALAKPPVKIDLFKSDAGVVLEAWRLGAVRAALQEAFALARPHVVVELMPHIWSPFLEDLPARLGAKRVAVLHDWRAHAGDPSGVVTSWLRRSALRADIVAALSQTIADEVAAARPSARAKLSTLFHPDLAYAATPIDQTGPLRVLFMGRLLAYKGLDLFVEGLELASDRGAAIDARVCGSGELGPLRARLERLEARIVNRWLSDDEIAKELSEAHMVAATYRGASQSGVVAAAFGAGRPVLATPVGALPEQVAHEHTGIVTAGVDAGAVAQALVRCAKNRTLVLSMANNVRAEAPERSMQAFVRRLAVTCRAN